MTGNINASIASWWVCSCERLVDGSGTMATIHVPRLRIGERPREWTRGYYQTKKVLWTSTAKEKENS